MPAKVDIRSEDGGYRDQILHATSDPLHDWYIAPLRRGWDYARSQDVQGMQALGVQAVTGGHGECECSECETGWAAAWSAWVCR